MNSVTKPLKSIFHTVPAASRSAIEQNQIGHSVPIWIGIDKKNTDNRGSCTVIVGILYIGKSAVTAVTVEKEDSSDPASCCESEPLPPNAAPYGRVTDWGYNTNRLTCLPEKVSTDSSMVSPSARDFNGTEK